MGSAREKRYRYVVLGAGLQGTAAAYDLVSHGAAGEVVLADIDEAQAVRAAGRVNGLCRSQIARAVAIDARDPVALSKLLAPADVVLCCLPYWMPPHIAPIAIECRTHMCDLGGDNIPGTGLLAMNEEARSAGVAIVPDTGLAPGMVTSLATHLMYEFERTESVRIACGVLPTRPVPPLHYQLAFGIEGLIGEYSDKAVALRDGVVSELTSLTECEEFDFAGVGRVEAFVTSGGSGTAPYSFVGQVRDYEYKTIRFPGHCAIMRAFRDLGLWEDQASAESGGIALRDITLPLMERHLHDVRGLDQTLIRVAVTGLIDDELMIKTAEVHDISTHDSPFTSMERLTGYSVAIHGHFLAEGRVAPGVHPYEMALPPGPYLHALRSRGIHFRVAERRLP